MIWAALIALAMAEPPTFAEYPATFRRCYDGDTCTFDVHLGLSVTMAEQDVRLYGIDAPELRGPDRARGLAARDYLIGLLQTAKRVALRVPQRARCAPGTCDMRGKYGRLLAFVVADGRVLNAALLASGYARPY